MLPVNIPTGTPFSGGSNHLLKCAGYDDGVIIGRADRPVYLEIMNADEAMMDAADVGGRDILHNAGQMPPETVSS
jgi:aldehyde:ferredoxin oxidoreductase